MDPREGLEEYPVAGKSFRINAQIAYAGLWNSKITLGVRNLLDEDPPFHSLEWYGFFRGHQTEKRFWYLRLEKEF